MEAEVFVRRCITDQAFRSDVLLGRVTQSAMGYVDRISSGADIIRVDQDRQVFVTRLPNGETSDVPVPKLGWVDVDLPLPEERPAEIEAKSSWGVRCAPRTWGVRCAEPPRPESTSLLKLCPQTSVERCPPDERHRFDGFAE